MKLATILILLAATASAGDQPPPIRLATPEQFDERVAQHFDHIYERICALEKSCKCGDNCQCPDCPHRGTFSDVERNFTPAATTGEVPIGVWQTNPDGTRWRVISRGEAKPTVYQPKYTQPVQSYPAPRGYRVQCGPGGCRLVPN